MNQSFEFNGRVYKVLFPEILRALTQSEREDLEGSVKAHGVQVPILADEDDGIIDGLHRCLTAEKCGLTEVPVRVVTGLSPEAKRALAVELNDCRRQQEQHELGQRRKTRAEKRAAIAVVVIETPELSDRAIAEKVKEKTGEKVSAPTVAKVREQLQTSGETLQLPRTTGRDGKSRPARKTTSNRLLLNSAIVHANGAIDALKSIPRNDAQRPTAFGIVEKWVETNLSDASADMDEVDPFFRS